MADVVPVQKTHVKQPGGVCLDQVSVGERFSVGRRVGVDETVKIIPMEKRDGKELAELPVPALERGSVLFELPVGSLGQGTYILRIRATLGSEQAEDMTAIVIAR